ncbi:hypothetical protein QBC43DRAFT_307215 [Cladorrhinum sp. PSN259]|nr:hypothetical protein QBC43DRAFT_307215 [Cladorrhinum sp. PSN259]
MKKTPLLLFLVLVAFFLLLLLLLLLSADVFIRFFFPFFFLVLLSVWCIKRRTFNRHIDIPHHLTHTTTHRNCFAFFRFSRLSRFIKVRGF